MDGWRMLEAVMESASVNEDVGHTLLLDAAYHLYAEEPHGWAETLHEAMTNGWPWPENLLITFALSLVQVAHHLRICEPEPLVSVHPDASGDRPHRYSDGGHGPPNMVGCAAGVPIHRQRTARIG